ncbi:serine/threonine protein phosphatase 1 [Onishia taeanensis]|uniref:Serine/threonine protein phosphatase 1 n=1 Tax=Onishia taeanensis TaxID=284577 RepID=A0A1G7NE20_9GAMM|nr:metallophosphoesterase [Halomonas taeanensis]SDF72308.1 serine/threonine protein phosphatase 1 [Halomonas taeanensis]
MTMIEKHDANTGGRDFLVGDIHGQYDLLMAAMARVEFDKTRDRLFSVGDLIDRGAQSFDCLSLPFEPWFFGVRGNHEMLAHDALIGDGAPGDDWLKHELWMNNGGIWALSENLKEVKVILGEALRYLPYARELRVAGKRIGIVHAEPPGDWQLLELEDHPAGRERLVWGRSRIKEGDATPVASIDAVVVGHTIVGATTTLGNVHYIDTGAFVTGNLTLIDAREVLG